MQANNSIHMSAPPPSILPSTDWLTPKQAADQIRVNVETIYEACKTRGLKHVRLGGRRSIRVHEEWLTDWMEEFTREYR